MSNKNEKVKQEKRLGIRVSEILYTQLKKESEEKKVKLSELCRTKLSNNHELSNMSSESMNMELRRLTEEKMIYHDLYNKLLRWIEDGKLGRTNLMVDSEHKDLEGMEYW